MRKDDVVRVRIDSDLKQDVESILDTLGLNVSDAVNMYFKMIKHKRGIPFDVKIPNETTVKAMEDAMKGIGDKYKDEEEMYKDSENW